MRQPHNNKQTQMKNQKTKRTKPQGEKNKAKPLKKPKKTKKPNLREKSEAQAQAIIRACFWFPGARAALEREKKDEEDD